MHLPIAHFSLFEHSANVAGSFSKEYSDSTSYAELSPVVHMVGHGNSSGEVDAMVAGFTILLKIANTTQ